MVLAREVDKKYKSHLVLWWRILLKMMVKSRFEIILDSPLFNLLYKGMKTNDKSNIC